jgi:hypothetical protein
MPEPETCCAKPRGRVRPLKFRLIAVLLCVCFIAAVLLSAAFILTHTRHEHDHDGPGGACAVCAHISSARNVLKSLFTAAAGGGGAACLFAVYAFLASAAPRTDRASLVRLKIRLNN